MADRPRLSVCVPSRNRQPCFQQTILDLIASDRTDVEFVFADNSDDPSVMNGFMSRISDPRIVYLASLDRVLSMKENWERTVARATGNWISVIGDDDFLDLDLAGLIERIEARYPGVEAIGWNRSAFEWPEARTVERSGPVTLINRVRPMPVERMFNSLFRWAGATLLPACPFGIYHSAASRRVIDRIRARYSENLFEHPVVDYDFSHKLIHLGASLVYVERPLSILGVSNASNSAAANDPERSRDVIAAYRAENGDRYEQEVRAAGFPFGGSASNAANIMAAQFWFKHHHGIEIDGWQENFLRCLANECRLRENRQSFDEMLALCRDGLSRWEGGRFLAGFSPSYQEEHGTIAPGGLHGHVLRVNQAIGGAATPADFLSIIRQILPAISELDFTDG